MKQNTNIKKIFIDNNLKLLIVQWLFIIFIEIIEIL
jgi:hypothetical protein